MVRKSLHETTFPKVKKYMSESDRALTAKDVAQFLEMSTSGANSVLQLMEVFKMVQKVKRGKTYYILKDVYDDDQISAMLPPKKMKVARIPKPRRARTPKRRRPSSRQSPPPADDSFMEEYLSAVRSQPSSGEGLSALSMLGLSQQEIAEEDIPTNKLLRDLDTDYLDDLDMDIKVEERKFGAQIKGEPFATVKYLPKDVRLLTRGETRYIKKQLKALDGYEEIKEFGTVFARFSALEYGRYGNVLYFSMGTNPWEYVKKTTIDRSTSDFILLPTIEMKRWSSWNQFLIGLKEPRERYVKEEYDKLIDQFMESGHKLVEMTVENRKANYVRNILRKRINERGLEEQVKASYVDDWIYLEKVERN
ncbi:MAG: hypothetical protein NWE88_03935 [Candidatus Bathyarchaeota archaeon]|nr:hypothetical protein [Candidatus Bathyarchaeota archaeon]